jgi:hypothetical protein
MREMERTFAILAVHAPHDREQICALHCGSALERRPRAPQVHAFVQKSLASAAPDRRRLVMPAALSSQLPLA